MQGLLGPGLGPGSLGPALGLGSWVPVWVPGVEGVEGKEGSAAEGVGEGNCGARGEVEAAAVATVAVMAAVLVEEVEVEGEARLEVKAAAEAMVVLRIGMAVPGDTAHIWVLGMGANYKAFHESHRSDIAMGVEGTYKMQNSA